MARGASAEASNAMAIRLPKRLEKDLERAQQEMERRSQVRLQMRNESVRAALAFAMAKHPRLGANSSARTLPPFFFESVFDALHVDSVFSVEQVLLRHIGIILVAPVVDAVLGRRLHRVCNVVLRWCKYE